MSEKPVFEKVDIQPIEGRLPSSLDIPKVRVDPLIGDLLNQLSGEVNRSTKLSKEVVTKWNEFATWLNEDFDQDIAEKVSDNYPMFKSLNVLSSGKFPVVNSIAKTLVFPSGGFNIVLYVGGKDYSNAITSSGLTIDLSTATGTSAWSILFNPTTQKFELVAWNNIFSYRTTHVLFATFRIVDGKYIFNMPCPFIMDGKLYGLDYMTKSEVMALIPEVSNNVIQNPLNANVKAILHRGYSQEAPENTLPAYQLAKSKGFSYVEVDIEWTVDNIPVCLHDSTINRTSNGTGNVNEMTLTQLKTYDFGAWKSSTYVNTKIPTFEEFLYLCKKLNLHPYIEIKGEITPEKALILNNIVRKWGMKNKVTWISFSARSLEQIKLLDDTARLGYVTMSYSENDHSLIEDYLKTPNNEVFVDLYIGDAYREKVEALLLDNIPVEIWTVNDNTSIKNVVQIGASGITTDYINVAEVLST